MTIDLEVEPGAEWNYEEEDYPVYCTVESELFTTQFIGEPVIVLHRFGGSYGEAKFLLKTVLEEQGKGTIEVLLTNKWGLGFKTFELARIQVQSNTKLIEILDISQDILFKESDVILTETIKQEAINPFLTTLDKLHKSLQGESRKFEDQYLKCQSAECQEFRTEGLIRKDSIFIPLLEDVFLPLSLAPQPIMSGIVQGTLEVGINDVSIWDFLRTKRTDPTSRQMMILSWGGYGKTTLLKHIAYTYATKNFSRYNVPKLVPILLILRKYSSLILKNQLLSLPDLISNHYIPDLLRGSDSQVPVHWCRDLLIRGDAIVMLDGFDEVRKAQRPAVALWINQQMRQYNKSVFLITSRPSAYGDKETGNQIQLSTVLWVNNLNDSQQQLFVEKWYQCQERYAHGGRNTPDVQQIAQRKAANLLVQIGERPELQVLAKTPLLLQMITTFHRFYSGSELPRRRVELYQEICLLQLKNRSLARNLETLLTQCEAQTILQMVALEMMIHQQKSINKFLLLKQIAVYLKMQDVTIDAHDFLNEVV